MSDAAKTLLARMLAAREEWLPIPGLPPDRQLCIRRPPHTEIPQLMLAGELKDLLRHAVDWRNVVESDLLGATLGSDAKVPFDYAVYETFINDDIDRAKAVATRVRELCIEFTLRKAAAEGNSPTT